MPAVGTKATQIEAHSQGCQCSSLSESVAARKHPATTSAPEISKNRRTAAPVDWMYSIARMQMAIRISCDDSTNECETQVRDLIFFAPAKAV